MLVFGIGTGLLSVCILWLFGLAACLLLSRAGKQLVVVLVVIILLAVSLVLVFYPREEANPKPQPPQENVDTLYIPRILYATFVVLFMLIAMVAYLLDHALMQNVAAALKAKKTSTF